MKCKLCNRWLRWDETDIIGGIEGAQTIRRIFLEGVGQVFACIECRSRIEGFPCPPPHVWTQVPMILEGMLAKDLPCCGLCRHSLPYGVLHGKHFFIDASMLTPEDNVEPGGYALCQECIAYWKKRGALADGQVPKFKGVVNTFTI